MEEHLAQQTADNLRAGMRYCRSASPGRTQVRRGRGDPPAAPHRTKAAVRRDPIARSALRASPACGFSRLHVHCDPHDSPWVLAPRPPFTASSMPRFCTPCPTPSPNSLSASRTIFPALGARDVGLSMPEWKHGHIPARGGMRVDPIVALREA
jgi:hypothetical protein